jgi:hypothetical protein
MVNASQPITLAISSDVKVTTNANGSKSYLLGTTTNSTTVDSQTGKATVSKSDITIYEGTINQYMNDSKNSKRDKAQSYQNNTTNNDERIGAVAGHESVHSTDKLGNKKVHSQYLSYILNYVLNNFRSSETMSG